MKYVKTTELDLDRTCFHFSRIDNRNSIEENGLVAVAGGENEAGDDNNNPAIYFSYGVDGLLKAVDVWIKWEYNNLRKQKNYIYSPTKKISEEIMYEAYQKIYSDFKNRNYYSLDLIEGYDPKTSDFSFIEVDKKKENEYMHFLYLMSLYERGEIAWKPQYPNEDMAWMYGSYSNFEYGNIIQDNWNMNTHIGNRIIPTSRIKIIEGENGRSDGLSIILELYNKYRLHFPDVDLSRLDDFIRYASERYMTDKDYTGGVDIGRRSVDSLEERKYQHINKISTQALGKQVLPEMLDVKLTDETERVQRAKLIKLDEIQHTEQDW